MAGVARPEGPAKLEGTWLVYAMPDRGEPAEGIMYALDAWDDRFGGKPTRVLISGAFAGRPGLPDKVRGVMLVVSGAVHGTYAWMPVGA